MLYFIIHLMNKTETNVYISSFVTFFIFKPRKCLFSPPNYVALTNNTTLNQVFGSPLIGTSKNVM